MYLNFKTQGHFVGYFIKVYPNFEVTRVTKTIMRVQVNNENYTPGTAGQEVVPFFFKICYK